MVRRLCSRAVDVGDGGTLEECLSYNVMVYKFTAFLYLEFAYERLLVGV